MISIRRWPFMGLMMLLLAVACKIETDPNLMIQKELDTNWTFNQVGLNEWLPATVPGTVHTDLIDNDKIEDPFYRLNEHDLQWIDRNNFV